MTQDARKIWSQKLAFLLAEEAKLADANQRFTVAMLIREAKDKLAELDAEAPDGPYDLRRTLVVSPPSDGPRASAWPEGQSSGRGHPDGRNDNQGPSEKVKVGIFALLFFGVVGFGVAMFWAPKQDSLASIQTHSEKAHDDPRMPTVADRDKLSDRDTLLALSMVGVDFSVGEATLKEWLNNSSTFYPAISIELLKLLKGKRLTQPVYLDVIVYSYEQAAASFSSSGAGNIDLARLKTAVIDSYNTRYGVAVTDFDKLLR